MKTNKIKLGILALTIALFAAGATHVQASDELWRPDKQTGVQIESNKCSTNPEIICAMRYHENEDEPFDVMMGEYTDN